MLKIKLARFGKRNQPHFRVVVNEARSKRDGKYIALLGHYAPTQSPKLLEINIKEYQEWIKKGAQPTNTVALLVKRFESGNPFPEKKKRLSKKAAAKANAEKEAKEAKPAETVKTDASTEKTEVTKTEVEEKPKEKVEEKAETSAEKE